MSNRPAGLGLVDDRDAIGRSIIAKEWRLEDEPEVVLRPVGSFDGFERCHIDADDLACKFGTWFIGLGFFCQFH